MNKRTKPDTIAADEAKARELGLSYGEYMGYRDTGYLETYIADLKKKKPEKGNIIESNIGGSSRVGKKRNGRLMGSIESKKY